MMQQKQAADFGVKTIPDLKHYPDEK